MESIRRLQWIVNGPLLEQLVILNREGQTLSQQDVWDGRLAMEFRREWEGHSQALQQAATAIEELRKNVAKINQDILRAGGNL